MEWEGRRVLVTGGGGFIGSHLVERLVEEGAETRALVHYRATGEAGWLDSSPLRNQMDIHYGDICDPDSVRAAARGREIVFHLAALIAIPYSYRAPGSYVRTNVEGTLNLLTAVRDSDTVERFLHTSTSEVYGTAIEAPIRETHPLQGQSPYSASKIGADKMVEAFYNSFKLPAVTVRPFNTFGPRQSARAVIPTVIVQALANHDVQLGNTTPTRDMNYVANTVSGYLAAASSEKALGRTINFGSGREISIGDLAELIIELTGSESKVVIDEERRRPSGSEVERLLASNELAKELTGWTPEVDLEEGLQRTIDWFREHSEYLRRADEYVV